ncbi:MAG: T9SS type A sorting domain-containing protein [Bacteroidales bacterium]|nr:T9SS type A sorting domain-containing protein [Bacteroidales bacterium]
MKAKIFLSILALALMISAFGQKPSLELTFTAIDSVAYVQLDSIKVMNRTQGGDTVLYWPDTVLNLVNVGIDEFNEEGEALHLFQNYPNPVKDQTTITLYIPERGEVTLVITDILGRQVINTEKVLERGYHSFRFVPGSGELFFFTANWKATSSSIKILTHGNGSGLTSSLEYTGSKITEPQFKRIEAIRNFSFSLGDELLYIGYVNGLQSGMLNAPETSETLIFQFATNIPCPGTPTVTYEGQVYNTIQIFSQCWLKENLNVGTMIDGLDEMENNGII